MKRALAAVVLVAACGGRGSLLGPDPFAETGGSGGSGPGASGSGASGSGASGTGASPGTGASGTGASGTGASSGTGGSVPPPPPVTITCGFGPACDAATEVCCVSFGGGGPPDLSCVPAGQCDGAPIACSDASSCADDEVCCAQFGGGDIGAACQPGCGGPGPGGGVQLCETDAECLNGEPCANTPLGFKTCGSFGGGGPGGGPGGGGGPGPGGQPGP